jgi:hypothetical protein
MAAGVYGMGHHLTLEAKQGAIYHLYVRRLNTRRHEKTGQQQYIKIITGFNGVHRCSPVSSSSRSSVVSIDGQPFPVILTRDQRAYNAAHHSSALLRIVPIHPAPKL